MNDLRETIRRLPAIDVHEHHMPEVFLSRDVGLVDLLRQSYAGWTRERPYPLPGEERQSDPMLAAREKSSWDDIAPFVEESGTSAFVRNLLGALAALYESARDGIGPENWQEVDREVRARHADPAWPHEIVRRAGVHRVITDPYADPLLDARRAIAENYRSVLRINAFACGWHPESRDHNGNSAADLARRLGESPRSFADYERLLETAVDTLAARNQVALKNALAYDRDVSFDEPDEDLARSAWGKRHPPARERKAFGDFVVDRLARLAGERNVPVEMHLGTALVRGSHPLGAAGLIERHPRTRFLLMHLAYPWSSDLLALAFVYRNVWLDLTWSFLLSPSHFQRAFHEAIEILPDASRMMLGGDCWHAEETYGAFTWARRLVGEVLEEKVASGYFSRAAAERLARRIFEENAAAFFSLPE